MEQKSGLKLLEEYEKRLKKQQANKPAVRTEDEYYEELGKLIEEHPITSPRAHRG